MQMPLHTNQISAVVDLFCDIFFHLLAFCIRVSIIALLFCTELKQFSFCIRLLYALFLSTSVSVKTDTTTFCYFYCSIANEHCKEKKRIYEKFG